MDLTFNADTSQVSVGVMIINDDSVENTEVFNGNLEASGTMAGVVASIDLADVSITEDPTDSKCEIFLVLPRGCNL